MNKVIIAKKLNILCLHGYFQDGAIMKDRTPALHRKLKSIAEFYYLDGPVTVNSMDGFVPELGTEKVSKAWWIKAEDGSYSGFDSAVDCVLKCYKEHGPFDGILGFSQGSGLGLFLAGLQEKGDINTDFKFVISYSGFYPSDITLQKVMDSRKISIPSFHIIGSQDDRVAPEVSRRVSECFLDPIVFYHEGGHFMPQNGELKEKIYQFLLQFVDLYCVSLKKECS